MKNFVNGSRSSSKYYVDILKERYAKGEITENEYSQMKEKLQ
ncbi:SHOCT domain-containing protein [Chengkuizengella marina]|uniref:SHOCT domain-containing protein n=1 Tax=Chengkuizengella marina TaxID=2507566 RepID=A0A6N9Q7G9_9BACL|nr:SHOCT domain-containing protein [Chengkuizengella marina]NBI30845.1 hypothetical protein [Chengkuizengella marina]